MSVKVRFAPSPTGLLHIGNVRTAVLIWLFCQKNDGHFLLRLDDTDEARSTEEYAQAAKDDLAWLGLTWDALDKQSDHLDEYQVAMDRLIASGQVYPCYETAEELSLKRKSLLGRGLPPIYDRGSLNLTADQIKAYEDEGRKPHYRFKLIHEPIEWHDHVRGPQHFHAKDLSDPVLIREDGRPLYTISSVVDDIRHDITHIVRGEDHVANTAIQIQLIQALGGNVPEFAHLPLIADKDGKGLSKRLGSLSIQELRDIEHYEPISIMNYLAKLGTSDAIESHHEMAALIENFAFDKISRSTPKFNPEELKRINAKTVHHMSYDAAKAGLDKLGLTEIDAVFWDRIKANLDHLPDAKTWWDMARAPLTPIIADEDQSFTAEIADLLPQGEFNEHTWGEWLDKIKASSDRKGKKLFMPIRLALTAQEHGPELKNLLPLLGHAKTIQRLKGEQA